MLAEIGHCQLIRSITPAGCLVQDARTSCRATQHSQLQLLLIAAPVITTDPRSVDGVHSRMPGRFPQHTTDQGSAPLVSSPASLWTDPRSIIPLPGFTSSVMDLGSVLAVRVFRCSPSTLHHNQKLSQLLEQFKVFGTDIIS